MINEDEKDEAGMGVEIGKAGTAVKEGIISSLRGINEIEAEMVSLVRNTVSNTLRAIGAVTGESIHLVRDVVKGAIQAIEEIGGGLTRWLAGTHPIAQLVDVAAGSALA
jgi:hypothetical protein